MLKKVINVLALSAGLYSSFLILGVAKPVAKKPNVLFICVDDLRPDLPVYGNRVVKAPNLERLAGQSAVFTNQYVTQPTCGASRFSLLTGRLPRRPIEIKNDAIEKQIAGKPRTEVPETFIDNLRRNGYYTVGIGKVSHSADGYVYGYNEPKSDQLELPYSWDEMLFDPGKWVTGWNAFFAYSDGSNRQSKKGAVKPYEKGDVEDNGYPDGLSADLAVSKLKELSKKDQPFFLSVGFFKPHLPFNAPAKYWDLYDESKLDITPSPDLPENVNTASLHPSVEFNQYQLGEEKTALAKPVSDAYAKKLRHAYYAAISYTDAQIGKVIGELNALGLAENTVIVVWSDHGWHLGDYRVWGKHTLFDGSLKSVLIVKTPGNKKNMIRSEIVSSIDIYPTLMQLCGVDQLPEVDGKSFAELLQKDSGKTWKNIAYSYYNRGVSMRSDQYRLTKYYREQEPVIELYDHRTDPYEKTNVAAQNPEIVKRLLPVLEKGDTGIFK